VVLILVAVLAILYYRNREQVMNFVFGGEQPPAES
jgi:hypothetical protein